MTPELYAAPAPPLNEIIAHIKRRFRGGMTIFVTCIVLSLLLAALLPARFKATAILAVLPAPEFTVRQSAGSHAFSTSSLAMDQIMKAETEILESAELHAATLQSLGIERLYPGLAPASHGAVVRTALVCVHWLFSPWHTEPSDPVAARLELGLRRIDADLRVLPAKDANIITVTYTNSDRTLAALTVNELLAGYATRRRQLYDDPQLAAVRRETDSLSRAVRDGDEAIAAFKSSHTLTDPAVERDLLVRRQSADVQASADSQSQAAEQQARIAALDHQISHTPAVIGLYRENDADIRLQAIDASVVVLRGRLAAARVHYQEHSRKILDIVRELSARLSDRRLIALDRTPSAERQGRNPNYDALLLGRATAAADQAAASARVGMLRTELAAIAARLADMPAQEATLAELLRHKEAADAAFANASRVLAEQHLTEAEDALRLANVRVIQAARVPQRTTQTGALVAIAGCLFGLLSGALWLVIGFAVRPTVLTPEGLAHATGLPVLGVFPLDTTPLRTSPRP